VLLLNALPIAVWLILIGVFLINGPVGYFSPGMAKISWLFSLLGIFMAGAAMLYKSDRSNIISGWLLILGGNIWFLISVAFLAPYPPLNTGMILPPLMSFVCVLAGKNLMDYSMLRKS